MAATKVQDLGTSAASASATTQVITLSGLAQAVAVGNHIIVAATGGGQAPSSVADSQGNTYQLDQATSAGDPHGAIFSAKVAVSLNNGDTITVTYAASTAARAIGATEYSGLAATGWFDVGTTGEGLAGTASDTGLTATSAQAESLIVGEVSLAAITGFTFESLSPAWVLDGEIESTGTIRGVHFGHRIVSDGPAQYAAKATWTTARNWKSTVAVYKAAAGGGAAAPSAANPVRIPNPFVGPMALRMLARLRGWRVPLNWNPPDVSVPADAPANVAAAALQPTVDIKVNAGIAQVTVAAQAPSVIAGTIINPGIGQVTVVAQTPTASVAPNAGVAAATAAAPAPSVAIKVNAGSASVIVAARDPMGGTDTSLHLYLGLARLADYIDLIKTNSLQIKVNADRRDSTMDVTLIGTTAQLFGGVANSDMFSTPQVEVPIEFRQGTTILFDGVIRSVKPHDLVFGSNGTGGLEIALGCQDWTSAFRSSPVSPLVASGIRTTIESDKARLQWLVDTWLGPGLVTWSGVSVLSSMPTQDFTGKTLAEAFSMVCAVTGADWYVVVGSHGEQLRYTSVGVARALTSPFGVAATDTLTSTAHGLSAGDRITLLTKTGGAGLSVNTPYYVIATGLTANNFKVSLTAGGAAVNFTTDITAGSWALLNPLYPYNLTDSNPDGLTSIGYQGLSIPEESTELRTQVLVIGGEGYRALLQPSAAYPATYESLDVGLGQGVIQDDQITDATAGQEAADGYFAEHAQHRVDGTVTIFRSGLLPGMDLSITSDSQLRNQHTLDGTSVLHASSPQAFRVATVTLLYPKAGDLRWVATFGSLPRLLHHAIFDIADAQTVARDVVAGVLKGYIGEIIGWPMATPPTGFLICDGTAVSRSTYNLLFAVIGTTFGAGNGSTTFNLPNFTGRFPLGVDGSHTLASTGGSLGHTHTGPSHTHTQPTHTHTQPTHTHTGPSHTHTGPSHGHSHSHAVSSHTHTGPSHTHSGGAHDHGAATDVQSALVDTTFTGASIVSRAGIHTHPIASDSATTGSGGTGATGSASPGTDTDATTGGTGATGSASGTTGADGNDDTGASGNDVTGASGTAATGANDPAYLAIYWAIRYA